MKIKKTIYTLLATLLLCTACEDGRNAKPTVAVTIEPLRYLVEAIAGDRVGVLTMVPGGSSPETYEPTARQMVELSKADLYIKVGNLGFERTWTERLAANAPRLALVDASQGIAHLGGDPHTWTSPRNMLRMALNVCNALASQYPADSTHFRARHDSLCTSISDLDERTAAALASLPTRTFLIYHPALTYFAHDYGLTQIAVEEEGREPSAASLQAVVAKAKASGARLMFVQREFGGRNVEAVRMATGARQVEINPLGYDWVGEMKKITDSLCNQ